MNMWILNNYLINGYTITEHQLINKADFYSKIVNVVDGVWDGFQESAVSCSFKDKSGLPTRKSQRRILKE